MRFALLVIALAVPPEDVRVDLRPSFVEGRTLRYTLDQKTRTRVAEFEQVVSMRTDCELDTVSASETGATCALRYTAASLVLGNSRGTLAYDTRNPDAPGSHPAFGSLLEVFVGETIELRFSSDGTVEEIRGLDVIREAPAAAAMRAFLEDQVFERTFSKLVAPAGKRASAVVGDAWETEEITEFDESTILASVLELELREADGDVATMAVDGRAEFRAAPKERGRGDREDESRARPPPPAFRVQTCDVEGTIEWDHRRRIVRTYDLAIELVFKGPGPGGQEATFSVSQESRTRLREGDAEGEARETDAADPTGDGDVSRGAEGSARPR